MKRKTKCYRFVITDRDGLRFIHWGFGKTKRQGKMDALKTMTREIDKVVYCGKVGRVTL